MLEQDPEKEQEMLEQDLEEEQGQVYQQQQK